MKALCKTKPTTTMMPKFVVLLSLSLWVGSVGGMPETVSMDLEAITSCPCSNPKCCEPITATERKEQFVFSTKNDERYWKLFDWSKLTTVATADYFNISLVCLAHSHNARVIFMAQVDEKTFMSPELRSKWIEDQIVTVRENYLDGLNFDYEGAIGENETSVRDAYTALVRETRERLRQEYPHSLIAVDVGWRPGVDERYYDYPALARYSDFLVLMAYDEQSQIYGECIAGPNCPYNPTVRGVKEFLNDYSGQITSNKLVLAIPWFGISYQCLMTANEKCYIKKIPYRGAPCSDSPGQPYDYKDIHKLRLQMPEHYHWNKTSSTPYIMYTNQTTNITYQVHYDNVESLQLKYKLVSDLDLRGAGIFTIEMLDYTDTPAGAQMRAEMFGALPPTKLEADVTGSRVGVDREMSPSPACPCSDARLCEPIKDTTRKEVVAFSLHNDETHWRLFDWSKITTVVMFNYLNTSLMCLAHSHGARAVVLGKVSKKVIFSSELRTQWVQQHLQIVRDNFLDGINFDLETPCSPKQKYFRRSYTALVEETNRAFRQVMPYTQISVDVMFDAFSHYRTYDYQGLARASDFLFLMAYDENTQKVGPNSGYRAARWGIKSYLKKKISASKIVLGLPWYGDLYECEGLVGDSCKPSNQPHHPIAQVCYSGIVDTLHSIPDHSKWNSSSSTPYFSYKTDKLYQIQYDDPESLSLKYRLAVQSGIRGVGFWHVDCLNFSITPQAQKMRDAMFGALPNWARGAPRDDTLTFVENAEKTKTDMGVLKHPASEERSIQHMKVVEVV